MSSPDNIFFFEVDLTLFIFVAYGDFSLVEFKDFIDRVSLTHIPDQIAIFFHNDTLSDSDLPEVIEQLDSRFHCRVSTHGFDAIGNVSGLESTTETFLAEGVLEIIRLRQPIQLPPPGKCFMKPSGKREAFFIQASNLFIRHAEMSFLALLLIRKWGRLFHDGVKVIYVDTIDLYGLTSLATRMRFGTNGVGPITVSYSSYTRYKEVLKHADVANSLMAISATTSHDLLQKIQKHTRWKDIERVVTILDIDPVTQNKALRKIEPKVLAHLRHPIAQSHIEHLPSIRLSGEKFTVDVDTPKSIVFKRLTHGRCLTHLKLKELYQLRDVFTAFESTDSGTLPIAVDRGKLFGHAVFSQWLRLQIEKFAPVSTSHVVMMHVNEAQVTPLLNIFEPKMPLLLTPEELHAPAMRIDGSAIVICPTFSTGSELLEVSRDLRKHPELRNVVYFTGVGTPESLEAFERVRKNLEVDGYKVISFCNVAFGLPKTLALSWQSEKELLKDEKLEAVEALQDRRQRLNEGRLTDLTLFYRVADLTLTKGFKYWDGISYPDDQRPSLLMFTTFAFLFEDARTNAKLSDDDRFAQLPNRRVLMDPENFFRYNDTLIQVSILRAAFPVELDYSDHPSHSRSILYLLRRAVQVKDGAVLYEFLLALATKRLQITDEAISDVRALVKASETTECGWFSRLDFFKDKGE